jgi:uncharacterized protein YqjF (DUF2071 family)
MPARPAPAFLTAEWRWLAMLNYEVDPVILKPRVPRGTELDGWQGRTFVSVVGFRFLDTRVRGWAIPFHRNFEEVNLRFYVRRLGDDGWRRGVVFVREIVPRWAIATLARLVYGENYLALPMRHRVDLPRGEASTRGGVEYGWRHGGRWQGLRAEVAGAPRPPGPGSQEEFITEHYWGYAAQRDGGTAEYRVEHPPWPVWRASDCTLDCDVAALYGPEFASSLSGAPASAFVAVGSPVIVHQGVPLEAAA